MRIAIAVTCELTQAYQNFIGALHSPTLKRGFKLKLKLYCVPDAHCIRRSNILGSKRIVLKETPLHINFGVASQISIKYPGARDEGIAWVFLGCQVLFPHSDLPSKSAHSLRRWSRPGRVNVVLVRLGRSIQVQKYRFQGRY